MDFLSRFGNALPHLATWWFVLLCAAVLLPGFAFRHTRGWVVAASSLVALAVGVREATKHAWLADDAWISFRYAKNLAQGHGLVWNVGERVEGYTNFLWTVVLAAFERVGLDAPHVALVLNLGAFVALIVVLHAKFDELPRLRVAPVVLAVSPALLEFATSGLEAVPAALAVTLAFLSLRRGASALRCGVWLLVAGLLRPDHVLFFAPIAVGLWVRDRRLPWGLSVGAAGWSAWWAARAMYYGDFFPNTFHAKSGGGGYWQQGFVYVSEFLLASGLAVSLVCATLVVVRLVLGARRQPDSRASGLSMAALMAVPLWLLYLAKVGGDFMEFRFALVVLPIVALAIEAEVVRRAGSSRAALGWSMAALLPLALHPNVIAPGEKASFIARESTFYPVLAWQPMRIGSHLDSAATELVRTLGSELREGPPLAAGCIGIIGYRADLRINDTFGLTNRRVGHKAIAERGRPGHEKYASLNEILADGATWSIDPVFEEPLSSATRFYVGSEPFFLVRDDAVTRERFERRGVRLPNVDRVVTSFVDRASALTSWRSLKILYRDRPEALATFMREWSLSHLEVHAADGVTSDTLFVDFSAPSKAALDVSCEPGQVLKWSVPTGQCEAWHDGHPIEQLDCAKPVEQLEVRCASVPARFGALYPVNGLLPTNASPERLAQAIRDRLVGAAPPEAVYVNHLDSSDDLQRPEVLLEGTAFGITEGAAARQSSVLQAQGRGLLNGYVRGDEATGHVRFTIPVTRGAETVVTMLVGGGDDAATRVEVKDGARLLAQVRGLRDERLRPWAMVLTPATDTLVVDVRDDTPNGWGHLLFDDLVVWRR